MVPTPTGITMAMKASALTANEVLPLAALVSAFEADIHHGLELRDRGQDGLLVLSYWESKTSWRERSSFSSGFSELSRPRSL